MLASARSIESKIQSLYDHIEEYNVSIAYVTETWIKSTGNYSRLKEDIELNKGLAIHSYNRPGKKVGGGVAIISDPTKIKLQENRFTRRG